MYGTVSTQSFKFTGYSKTAAANTCTCTGSTPTKYLYLYSAISTTVPLVQTCSTVLPHSRITVLYLFNKKRDLRALHSSLLCCWRFGVIPFYTCDE